MVALTREPGAPVARIARENGVNANQLYTWIRQEKQGRWGAAAEAGALIAVRVRPEARPSRPVGPERGYLELRHARARLRIESGADPVLLRIVLEHLLG